MVVGGNYDFYLVALSFAVACFASYTALDLGTRIRLSEGRVRGAWLITAAIAMGGGIWSMHFIAMLAFSMPMATSFDFKLTAVSLLAAIGVTSVAFYGMGQKNTPKSQPLLSGAFMGVGVVSMHYIGMAAMRMPAHLHYDLFLVALSVVIAIVASVAALWLAFRTIVLWQRFLAAVIMGIAISGMHYTGMAAAVFTTAHDGTAYDSNAAELAQTNLALAIATITFVILVLALVASMFDRQFATLAERETMLLRDREEMMRRIYRDTPLPLHTLGPNGVIEKVSDAWLDLIGCTRDEAVGRPLTDFMTDQSKKQYDNTTWPQLLLGSDIREAEYQFTKKTGETLDVLMSVRQEIIKGKPQRALGGLIDVTARKRAEKALLQSQRMEAIGQLTGGVAHDFNNLLMVINAASEQFRRRLNDDWAVRSSEMISAAVKRGQILTGHLLSFARRQTLQTTVVNLPLTLTTIGDVLKRSLRGDIDIRISSTDCNYRVLSDPTEFELALLNLGVNARDAMPEGGTLSIAVRQVRLAGDAEFDGLRGDFIAIETKDTGIGISPETLPHVFDPFFTTKGPGKGTGLGLSQVYGFAKQSGGTVKIDSAVGRGTTVTLYLPATDEPSPPDEAFLSSPTTLQTKKGAVLLVEDSADVAAVTSDLLTELGYTVEHVASGTEALQKLRKTRYVLIFSDILMPDSIGGLELAGVIRDHHPDTRILLMTGFSEKAQQAMREGFKIVRKPFGISTLATAIDQLQGQETPGIEGPIVPGGGAVHRIIR
jgi:PAS domain S-box-containing protein